MFLAEKLKFNIVRIFHPKIWSQVEAEGGISCRKFVFRIFTPSILLIFAANNP